MLQKKRKSMMILCSLISMGLMCAEYEPLFYSSRQNLCLFRSGNNIAVYESGDIWEYFSVEDMKLRGDGYYSINIVGTERDVIFGGNHFYIFSPNNTSHRAELGEVMIVTEETYEQQRKWFDKNLEYSRENIAGPRIFPLWNIKNVKSSSILTESSRDKTIGYTPDELNKILSFNWIACSWYSKHIPWAEGKKDEGIGESLKITFETPESSILVLNGFVDPKRKYLYKANNRLKKVIIKSEGFEMEYEFEDVVMLSEIVFPEVTEEVELIIKEVYRGSRWNDTVVTAIMTNYTFEEDDLSFYDRLIKDYKLNERCEK